MWTTEQNLDSDRPSHRQNRKLDQDYHFMEDGWTDFFTMDRPSHGRRPWTEVDGGRREADHIIDGFSRRTIKYIKRWAGGQMDESPSEEP